MGNAGDANPSHPEDDVVQSNIEADDPKNSSMVDTLRSIRDE